MICENVKKPVLSPNFTIDDIHKLREYNYEITKGMTIDERINFINSKGKEIVERLQLV